jgi:hypothetical protein
MPKNATDIGPVIRAVKQANQNIELVHDAVYHTDQNVQTLLAGITHLTAAFNHFAENYALNRRQETAITRLAEIKKEQHEKFGAYGAVRQTAKLMLQLLEDGNPSEAINRLASVENTACDYWLACCLSVVFAWLGDRPDKAREALEKASRLNNEKTALFFILFSHKAARQGEALEWVRYYFANPNMTLNKDSEIILEAYRTGKHGADGKALDINALGQSDGWGEFFDNMRPILPADAYPLLQKHSPLWPALKNARQTADLHGITFEYITTVFNRSDKYSTEDILTRLLTERDDAELLLHEKAQYEQRIIDCGGDEQSSAAPAKKRSTYTPGIAFTIVLNRDRVEKAYGEIIQSAYLPEEIAVNVGTFSAKITVDTCEMVILDSYYRSVETEKQAAVQQAVPSVFDRLGLYLGGFLGLVGIICLIAGVGFLAWVAFASALICVINHYISKKNIRNRQRLIDGQYEHEREKGIITLRGIFKEINDFRDKMEASQDDRDKITDLLAGISIDPPVPKALRGRKPKPVIPPFAMGLPEWSVLPDAKG